MKEYLAANIAASKGAGLGFALDADTGAVTGDLGWHSGTFHVTDAKGASVGTGKYVEVWHKTDGKWTDAQGHLEQRPSRCARAAGCRAGARAEEEIARPGS